MLTVCCSVLQRVWQRLAVCVAMCELLDAHCVLQCLAVSCSVLQGVLQCVAVCVAMCELLNAHNLSYFCQKFQVILKKKIRRFLDPAGSDEEITLWYKILHCTIFNRSFSTICFWWYSSASGHLSTVDSRYDKDCDMGWLVLNQPTWRVTCDITALAFSTKLHDSEVRHDVTAHKRDSIQQQLYIDSCM